MLRIIPMEEATGEEGSFAIWDTVTDSFVENNWNGREQTWTINRVQQSSMDEAFKARVFALWEVLK